MRRTAILTLTFLTFLSGACLAPNHMAAPPRVQIVDQLRPMPSTGSMDPLREEPSLQTIGGSRLALKDLYDRANDERDSYLIELEHQTRALEIAAERQRGLEQQHRELQEAFVVLDIEKTAILARREQLVESLVTARIRRLEAEIAWLSGTLEHEFQVSVEALPASAQLTTPLEESR